MMYDIFDPKNGRTVATVRTQTLAKLVRWIWGPGYDYCPTGTGWIGGNR